MRFFTKSAETTLEGLERHENVIIRSAKEKERNSRGTDDEDLKKKKKSEVAVACAAARRRRWFIC